MNRVILAGGGTGGHIYPAVSIARAILQKDPTADVQFVGAQGGLEERLVPKEGFPLHVLTIGPLNRNAGLKRQLQTVALLPWSLLKAFLLVLRLKPSLVIGVGGYASAPFTFAATLLGIPCALFEPNAYPGLANRWLSRFVKLNMVVFDKARGLLKGKHFAHVGLPVRQAISAKMNLSNAEPTNLSNRKFRVLVFGGSQGARRINQVVFDALASGDRWLEDIEVVHQIGQTDYHAYKGYYAQLRQSFPRLHITEYEFLFDMPERYAWADLIVCRAGASTVAELIALKKPALFIPLPSAADDHQTANAQSLVQVGAALMCPQTEFTAEKLKWIIAELKSNPEKLAQMQKALAPLQTPNAAEKIAEICLSLIY